jgi:hypothetical protein
MSPEHLRYGGPSGIPFRDLMRIGAGAMAAVALVAVVTVGSPAHGATRATDHVSIAGGQCTAQEARSVVTRFIVNFNDGDLRQVNRLFSPAGLFKWYSVSGPEGRLEDASLDRATLIPYFASRHRQGERLTLRSFQWKGYGLGYGQFLYSLTRSARDLRATSGRERWSVSILGRSRSGRWGRNKRTAASPEPVLRNDAPMTCQVICGCCSSSR